MTMKLEIIHHLVLNPVVFKETKEHSYYSAAGANPAAVEGLQIVRRVWRCLSL
jgi:hypothetical protein